MVSCSIIFVIVKNRKQFKSLPSVKRISILSCDHSKNYSTVTKMNSQLLQTTSWVNPKHNVEPKKSDTQETYCMILYKVQKSIKYPMVFVIVVIQLPAMSKFCDPMDCSMPGLPVPHHLPEFAQVYVHCISNAIQPSHPLTPSSPSALNLSQHQRLSQRVICSHQMTKIPELQL